MSGYDDLTPKELILLFDAEKSAHIATKEILECEKDMHAATEAQLAAANARVTASDDKIAAVEKHFFIIQLECDDNTGVMQILRDKEKASRENRNFLEDKLTELIKERNASNVKLKSLDAEKTEESSDDGKASAI